MIETKVVKEEKADDGNPNEESKITDKKPEEPKSPPKTTVRCLEAEVQMRKERTQPRLIFFPDAYPGPRWGNEKGQRTKQESPALLPNWNQLKSTFGLCRQPKGIPFFLL